MKYLGGFVVCTVLLLTGCGADRQTIAFTGFDITVKGIYSGSFDGSVGEYHIGDDSLVVIRDNIDANAGFDTRIESNSNVLRQYYPRITLVTEAIHTLACRNEDLQVKALQWFFDAHEDPLYFVQYFFIQGDEAYVVSYASKDKKTIDRLIKQGSILSCSS